MKKNKAFTLIELIAVLVIMAILALIVTPLVMNIIKKARISADKRSIDAYGRSIELAIATYLLDEGRFPTSISDLTIEYSGDEVICSTTDLNSDSTIYLSGCTVAGRTVDYEYRTQRRTPAPAYQAYSVGNEVTYNNVDYYVIKDSSVSESMVTLLKAEPFSYEDIQTYSSGTDASIYNLNGYGGIQFNSSSNEYETSYVKTVVDVWKESKAPLALDVRLITVEDLLSLGYVKNSETNYSKSDDVFTWIYNSDYWYWTMSLYSGSDLTNSVWGISQGGSLDTYGTAYFYRGAVRPVITISKSSL